MKPSIVLNTVQVHLVDTVYPSTCSLSDAGARFIAAAVAGHFALEARTWKQLWPEAAKRAIDASEEFMSIALYEDVETCERHAEERERYEERGNLRHVRHA